MKNYLARQATSKEPTIRSKGGRESNLKQPAYITKSLVATETSN